MEIEMMTRQELLKQDIQNYRKERQQEAVVSYPPRWVTIGIGSRCTNRCLFCSYHSDDARNNKSKVYNIDFKISFERFQQQVNMFYTGRVPHVHICATGEPFLHERILDMIDYVISIYGLASFQSNFNKLIMDKGHYVGEILKRSDRIKYIVTDVHAGNVDLFNAIKCGSDFNNILSVLRKFQEKGIKIIGSFILTKTNYRSLRELIDCLVSNRIAMQINVVNLFAHMFNSFTAQENVYNMEDTHIEASLLEAKQYAEQHGIEVNTPKAFNDPDNVCSVFWDKVQIWPVLGVDEKRNDENLIPHACNAVVLGDMNSLGYVFDYQNVMDFWNNDIIVGYRKKILAGLPPDRCCWTCSDGVNLRSEGAICKSY